MCGRSGARKADREAHESSFKRQKSETRRTTFETNSKFGFPTEQHERLEGWIQRYSITYFRDATLVGQYSPGGPVTRPPVIQIQPGNHHPSFSRRVNEFALSQIDPDVVFFPRRFEKYEVPGFQLVPAHPLSPGHLLPGRPGHLNAEKIPVDLPYKAGAVYTAQISTPIRWGVPCHRAASARRRCATPPSAMPSPAAG